MEWTDYIAEIRACLELEHTPVFVNYAAQLSASPHPRRFMVCEALLKASQGMFLDLSVMTLDCHTAIRALGLGDPLAELHSREREDPSSHEAQQLCELAMRQQDEAPSMLPPVRLADHILMGPADQTETCPDLVVFICTPEQACRLITLDSHQTGVAPRLEMSGSTCHQAITYPYVTGELNLSLLDFITRQAHGYQPENLLVSVPYARFQGIIASLDGCAAGRRLK